jgi:hypothetical protein
MKITEIKLVCTVSLKKSKAIIESCERFFNKLFLVVIDLKYVYQNNSIISA